MNFKLKKLAAAAASLAVAASSSMVSAVSLTADAAYGRGGNGSAIMEYLDRGVYAIKSGNGMFISWRFNANDDDNAEFQLFRDGHLYEQVGRPYELLGRKRQFKLKIPR